MTVFNVEHADKVPEKTFNQAKGSAERLGSFNTEDFTLQSIILEGARDILRVKATVGEDPKAIEDLAQFIEANDGDVIERNHSRPKNSFNVFMEFDV